MTNVQFKQSGLRMVAALVVGLGSGACGGSDGDESAETDAGAQTPNASALAQRLGKCPEVGTTSDLAAVACLSGAYPGKTLAGEDCTLTVGTGGTFQYAAPALEFSYTPSAETISVFTHMNVQNFQQLIWLVSDPASLETWYELDFTGRFGSNVPANDSKIEIEATSHVGSAAKSSSCIVEL